jgi:hypothetical protein
LPERSSSPEEETCCFHDPFGTKRLLEKIAQFLAGGEPPGVHLREARCAFCRWPIKVLFDRKCQRFLHTGWVRLDRAHNLEVGCLLNFKYKGDNEVRVKVFDGVVVDTITTMARMSKFRFSDVLPLQRRW